MGKGMTAIILTDRNFETEVLKSDLPVLVDFWAEWCPPCKMAEPVLEGLEGEEGIRGKIKVGKLNVDENPKTAERYGILSIPTVIFFKKGKEVGRKIGFLGKGGYKELIDKVLGDSE